MQTSCLCYIVVLSLSLSLSPSCMTYSLPSFLQDGFCPGAGSPPQANACRAAVQGERESVSYSKDIRSCPCMPDTQVLGSVVAMATNIKGCDPKFAESRRDAVRTVSRHADVPTHFWWLSSLLYSIGSALQWACPALGHVTTACALET